MALAPHAAPFHPPPPYTRYTAYTPHTHTSIVYLQYVYYCCLAKKQMISDTKDTLAAVPHASPESKYLICIYALVQDKM
jgi:hypothetical protein